MWIGKTHLSWAGAEGLVRVRMRQPQAKHFAVQKVRVTSDGFDIEFTEPASKDSFANLKIRAHTYKYHIAYGSPKIDEHEVAVVKSSLDATGRKLNLKLGSLREGYVYTMNLSGAASLEGRLLLGDQVFYTLLKSR